MERFPVPGTVSSVVLVVFSLAILFSFGKFAVDCSHRHSRGTRATLRENIESSWPNVRCGLFDLNREESDKILNFEHI
jgi:hypothetical protein